MMFSFSIFAIGFLWVFLLVAMYDKFFRFKDVSFCKHLGWHDGRGGAKSFDGCSIHATCSRCGKKVMQDSQGNWF